MNSYEPLPEKRISRLGVASFVISLVGLVSLVAIFGYAGYKEINTPGGIDEDSSEAALIGLVAILCMILVIVGFIMGLVSLFQKDERRAFGIVGTVLSLLAIAITSFLIWLGSTQ